MKEYRTLESGISSEEMDKLRVARLQDLMFLRQFKGHHAEGRAQKPKDYIKKRKARKRMTRHSRKNNR